MEGAAVDLIRPGDIRDRLVLFLFDELMGAYVGTSGNPQKRKLTYFGEKVEL